MPIKLPVLDDRRFEDIIDEARSLIPSYDPDWTNHNPTDPGITMLELFAYLAEMLIYRQNRVTGDNVRSFMKLLNGPDWTSSGPGTAQLAEDIRTTVAALRKRERAVTCADYEALALEADDRVSRARCVENRNLLMDLETERRGHISLIVVPKEEVGTPDVDQVLTAVRNYLEPRRLLTTFLHVMEPFCLTVTITAAVVANAGEDPRQIRQRVVQRVCGYLDPRSGGNDGRGWPFGRDVFVSEIYDLLDRVEGVDFVSSVDLVPEIPERLMENVGGELVGVRVESHELVCVECQDDESIAVTAETV